MFGPFGSTHNTSSVTVAEFQAVLRAIDAVLDGCHWRATTSTDLVNSLVAAISGLVGSRVRLNSLDCDRNGGSHIVEYEVGLYVLGDDMLWSSYTHRCCIPDLTAVRAKKSRTALRFSWTPARDADHRWHWLSPYTVRV